MTIFFSDVSHYDRDAGREIPDGDQIVIAKSTHGMSFVDSAYTYHRDVAKARGIYFTAYHWLSHGYGAGQAQYCYSVVGSTPVMVDAEDMPGNTGYNGVLAVGDIANFVVELRRLGGISNLVYLPHWYWQDHMGSPDLTPLVNLGVGLVSSNYTSYSDSGPGWTPYGGYQSVAQWQFTSTPMDRNAYRGSVADYIALTSKGGGMPAPDFTRFDPGMEQMVADLWHFFKDGKGAYDGTELRNWYLPKQWAAAASQVTTLTDTQAQQLTSAVVAAVTSAHDALTDADKPVIQAAVEQALSGLTLHAQ